MTTYLGFAGRDYYPDGGGHDLVAYGDDEQTVMLATKVWARRHLATEHEEVPTRHVPRDEYLAELDRQAQREREGHVMSTTSVLVLDPEERHRREIEKLERLANLPDPVVIPGRAAYLTFNGWAHVARLDNGAAQIVATLTLKETGIGIDDLVWESEQIPVEAVQPG